MPNFLSLTVPDQPASQAGGGAVSWSPFQDAIFSAVRDCDDPLLIQAVAGSGKTTTIIEATRFATGPNLFLAFNKAIAEDIRGKLPSGEAKTLNALGHRLWMQNASGARLEARKTERLVEAIMPPEARRKFGYIVQRIVSTAKASAVGIDSEVNSSDFEHFITNGEWDIDDADIVSAAHYAAKVFSLSRDDLTTFDFDDQLYGPVYRHWPFPAFGTVLVDEAQDLNRIQHLFLEALCQERTRLIAVGDRNQAIYAFRGALANSLDLLKEHFRMAELPLSISYRCPLAVVAEAQELVPYIQARPGAPAGLVSHPRPDSSEDPELFEEGWLVVCRNNAPLFAAIMRHVRARKPCRVLSNALEGLAGFIKKFRTEDPSEMLRRLDRWLQKETMAAESKGMAWKVASLEDKAETVRALSEGFRTVEEILGLIRSLSEGRSGPIFSTIHKAKGLEAEHVYFLRPDLVPGWWVMDKDALQQEYNLRYVAITRAKQSLTYGIRRGK
jgi:DNA helicase-2/ATP-dependent DNA helicase PcrA